MKEMMTIVSKGAYPTIEENVNELLDWFGLDVFAEGYLKSHPPEEWLEPLLSQENVDYSALLDKLLAQMNKNQARQLLQSVLAELEKED